MRKKKISLIVKLPIQLKTSSKNANRNLLSDASFPSATQLGSFLWSKLSSEKIWEELHLLKGWHLQPVIIMQS